MGTKKAKFTFKTIKPTGKWKWLYKPDHKILLNKIHVGSIDEGDKFKIRLKIVKKDIMEDGNPNCVWRWAKLSFYGSTLDEAKTYLNENIDTILNTLKLYIENESN